MRRILVVGTGGIGMKHIKAFGSLDAKVRLSAIDTRREALAQAAQLGVETLDSTWEDLNLSPFDGVVICAPAPAHVHYATRCLREGIPVLSEKPLSHSWDGVDDLLELAGREGASPSGVAYVRRYHPAYEHVRDFLASGEIGEMLTIRMIGGQHFPTFRPDYRETYYSSREMGGGCLLDCASHFIDLVQWYMGPIAEMNGFIDHLALDGVDVEDTAVLSMKFEERTLGSVHINQFQPANENILEFCGLDGVLRVEGPEYRCRVWRKKSADWSDLPLPTADYPEAFRRQASAFMAAIDGGPPLRTSIAEAAMTLRLCLDILDKEVS